MKKALITGITGQDGSYLADLLLSKGYEVHGLIRKTSLPNDGRIRHIRETPDSKGRLFLHYADLSESGQIINILKTAKPEEVYNLGGQSHVRVSFDIPEYTGNITGIGVVRMLESIKNIDLSCKFYQASSSEIFGSSKPPQNEKTPLNPCSPYALAKSYGYHATKLYRRSYDLFASNGICFNHESPRRGDSFVSKKIVRAVVSICLGTQKKLYLGNLDAKRDWGYAPEYVEMMWAMLQHDNPCDMVFGTDDSHTVQDFVEDAFSYVGLDWNDHVEQDPRFFRPSEVEDLSADSSLAKKELGWDPKIGFSDLIKIMIDAESKSMGYESPGEGEQTLVDRFPDRWWPVD